MSERCSNCGEETRKYVMIDITQFQDVNEDPEQTEYANTTLCIDCWNHIKEESSIFQITIPRYSYYS
jgi:hypothetical protein